MEFLHSLSALSGLSAGAVAIVAAIFTRISALAFFLPGIGERTMPVRIRLAAAMAIALAVTPAVMADASAPTTTSGAAFMIAAEAVAGAIIGFSIRIAIFLLQTAGAMASQSLSLAQLFNSAVSDGLEPPMSTLLTLAAITLALTTGLHFKAVTALIMSFSAMPLGQFPGVGETGLWAAERTAFAFSAALSLAMPFVILGFVYNLAIGAANRAMPQLMVAFVGVPAVTLAGMVLLALTAPLLLDVWLSLTDDILQTLMGGA